MIQIGTNVTSINFPLINRNGVKTLRHCCDIFAQPLCLHKN
jgi:hypothetical protein